MGPYNCIIQTVRIITVCIEYEMNSSIKLLYLLFSEAIEEFN